MFTYTWMQPFEIIVSYINLVHFLLLTLLNCKWGKDKENVNLTQIRSEGFKADLWNQTNNLACNYFC